MKKRRKTKSVYIFSKSQKFYRFFEISFFRKRSHFFKAYPFSYQKEHCIWFFLSDFFKYLNQKIMIFGIRKASNISYNKFIFDLKFLSNFFSDLVVKSISLKVYGIKNCLKFF